MSAPYKAKNAIWLLCAKNRRGAKKISHLWPDINQKKNQ